MRIEGITSALSHTIDPAGTYHQNHYCDSKGPICSGKGLWPKSSRQGNICPFRRIIEKDREPVKEKERRKSFDKVPEKVGREGGIECSPFCFLNGKCQLTSALHNQRCMVQISYFWVFRSNRYFFFSLRKFRNWVLIINLATLRLRIHSNELNI